MGWNVIYMVFKCVLFVGVIYVGDVFEWFELDVEWIVVYFVSGCVEMVELLIGVDGGCLIVCV